MLTFLKAAAGTWIAKILLGLLILSFAVWGITGASFNFATGSLASVGSINISTPEFQREYFREINRVGQQFGQRITSAQARQFGIDRQVLSRMVSQATLDDRVNAFGIGVSEDKLAEQIFRDPAFQNADGEFSPQRYQSLLYQAQLSERDFLEEQRGAVSRQQLIDSLVANVVVPETLTKLVSSHINEARTVDYITVGATDIDTIAAPTDADLEAYFGANKGRYRAPEYRSLQYVSVVSNDLDIASAVSDADTRAYYEDNKDRFFSPEKRTIKRITFSNVTEADAAAEKLSGGMSFDALLKELQLNADDVDLGTLEKSAVFDKKLSEIAFDLEAGEPSGVVDGDFGKMIVFVESIDAGKTQTFEDVKDQLKSELGADEINRLLSEKLDAVEDARVSGATLGEIANRIGAKLTRVDNVARSGRLLAGGEITETTPALNALLDEAFESDVGVENDVIEVDRDGFVWFEVVDIKPARERELDEVKAEVTSDWTNAETAKAVREKADALLAKVQEGATLDGIAGEVGSTISTAQDVRRNTPSAGLSGAAIAAAFQGASGHVATAESDEENTVYILQVTGVDAGTGDTEEQTANLSDSLQNDLLETYIVRVQAREGTTINPEALSYATDLDGGRHGGHGG